ncbi:MAG TPA: hypothetical protein VG348_06060 [Acidimicrobiia bacterium]|jgi:hypothetical protein|nr:hypothetical protein [Acidimicrobiia bacterium]
MQDVIYVAALLAFFALAGLFVIACDRIIGPDEAALADETSGERGEEFSERRAA